VPEGVTGGGGRSAVLDEAFTILGEIQARGRRAVIVGGAVRDQVLGRPVTDVDLATDMPLAELAALFTTHAVGRSERFETVVVVRRGHAFEISRFRGAATQREPDAAATPADIRTLLLADTAHRDFTINTLLMGPDGAVVDLQGGLADLRDRVVRCVGSAAERFAEDPARILRAVRFAACLGFGIEAETAAAMTRHAPRLGAVAGERIGKEILKIAAQSGAALADALELMERHGLLAVLLPEIESLKDLPQPAAWHPEGDVVAHTLAALRSSSSPDPAVNLAVLLHDVGKAPMHREAAGRHRYHGHEAAGAAIADAVARRLRLPRLVRAALAFAVGEHQRAARFAELRRSKRLALLRSPHWPTLRAAALCDLAARGDPAAVERLAAAFHEAEADTGSTSGSAPGAPVISGERIMALSGLAPGPLVGDIQRRVSEWALDNRVDDRARIESEVARLAAGRAGTNV
jgi:tRNA nucleotidyltransferase/poly(A) polymerase